jgi:ubiquinone/menaquinone biosynthesis C-methylase UbiE
MWPGALALCADVANLLHLTKDSVVMDVGAFLGEQSCFLATQYRVRIVAVEWWCDHNLVQQKVNERGLGTQIVAIKADARNLQFAEESFDAILCQNTFEMMKDDRPTALKEMIRVLRPGGYLGIAEPMTRCEQIPRDLKEIDQGDWEGHFNTLEWNRKLFEEHGLEITHAQLSDKSDQYWQEYAMYDPGMRKSQNGHDHAMIAADKGRWLAIGIVVGRKV